MCILFVQTGLIGLENLGATCYINTFLQVCCDGTVVFSDQISTFKSAVLFWYFCFSYIDEKYYNLALVSVSVLAYCLGLVD